MIFLRNQKGMVLIIAYMVVLVLAILSAAFFMRAFQGKRLSQQQNDSMKAFYEAEAGIAYAYFEESKANFQWYTHEDKNTRVTSTHAVTHGTIISFVFPIPKIASKSYIGPDGLYRVSGRRFAVKTYPEVINGSYSKVIVIHSQATVGSVIRTVEYRLGQISAYKYFFFYPYNKDFYSDYYDGRNYGSIQVNGNMIFHGDPTFAYLTELTSGGYITRPYTQFYDRHGAYAFSDYWACPVYQNSTNHFDTGTTTFKIGHVDNTSSSNVKSLPYYLEGAGAFWNYDKYPSSGNTTPAHYTISNTDLTKVAATQSGVTTVTTPLLSSANTIDITATYPAVPAGTEQQVFKSIFNSYKDTLNDPIWDVYWNQWKANHATDTDYQPQHDSGIFTETGKDWERKFLMAYNGWSLNSYGMVEGINKEWWQDLSYGDDRATLTNGNQAPALAEDAATGEPISPARYLLNTQQQGSTFGSWLQGNNLNTLGEDMMLVQDASQGGKKVDVGNVVGSSFQSSTVIKKAQNGGIYIGGTMDPQWVAYAAADAVWQAAWGAAMNACLASSGNNYWYCGDTVDVGLPPPIPSVPEYTGFSNPIADCVTEKTFYNSAYPRTQGSSYSPSNAFVIDVKKLKEKIDAVKAKAPESRTSEEQKLANFNGVIYVDLSGRSWSTGVSSDINNDGIMLVNGEALPSGGLSLGTPNNVFIKGNSNLDPLGDFLTRSRNADDPDVISRVTSNGHTKIDGSTYNLCSTCDVTDPNKLTWQPAEIITQRMVYTLSENFPETAYMPMAWYHNYQYYDEDAGRMINKDGTSSQDYVHGDGNYPTDSWAPTASTSSSCNPSCIQKWLDATGEILPAKWTKAWVDNKWPSGGFFPTGTGNPDFIAYDTLRSNAWWQVEDAYDAKYSYAAIHGSADGNGSPTTPSEMHRVGSKHIYNTAIVTPYDTSPSVLEYWDAPRVINGAFIQLPTNLGMPTSTTGPTYSRINNPANTFNYESRFGKGSAASNTPRVGLTFGAESSWRELASSEF
jgi:hypothetical protein